MTRPARGCLPRCAAPQFFAAEYSQVVLPNRITSREAYYKVRRPGRGVALDRAKRAAVWDVIEAYRAQGRIAGTVDFAEAATHRRGSTCGDVASVTGEYVADHVLVDEGQDLGPAHWLLMRALVGEHADDLFIAEDSHQRIYGQRIGAVPVRHPHRRPVAAADAELPDHRAEPRLRDQRAARAASTSTSSRARSRPPGTGRRAAARCPSDPVRDADRGTGPGG